MQLQRKLTESLREFVSNPVVTVMVVEVADRVVYVMGEVNTPGAVPLKGSMTVLQALAVAGGFKDFANKGGIKVLRKTPGSDRVETIPFSYKDALRTRRARLLPRRRRHGGGAVIAVGARRRYDSRRS